MELASIESRTIVDSVTVAAIKTNKKETPNVREQKVSSDNARKICGNCGRQHGQFCVAKYWKCYNCGRKGHAKNMCPNRGKINQVEDEENELNFINEVFSVQVNPEMINLKINNVPITMEIDTGAAVTVMSLLMFRKNFPSLSLQKISKQCKSVTGEILDVAGSVLVEVELNSKRHKLELLVFKANQRVPLMGRNWLNKVMPRWRRNFAQDFQVDCVCVREDTREVSGVVNLLQREFSIVFSEKQTTIKGFKATIVLKEEAKPVFCKPYSVPYALKPKVEQEIISTVESGILIPVQHSEWASPIVVVPKKDQSLRICVDFKGSVNKWVDFYHYPLPNIDDILASLSAGSIFTVLDLAGAYQQIEIAD